MSEPLEVLQLTLKSNHVSSTKARRLVFEALLDSEPQTMQQIVKRCNNAVDRASIYRIIALFEQLGIVERLQMGWKYKLELTDRFMHHHHHLSCMKCGAVIALPEDATLEARLQKLAKAKGFMPQHHQLEIRGLCPACQKT
jgi:Fur family transcriptional regulator, ferric uptake regulator